MCFMVPLSAAVCPSLMTKDPHEIHKPATESRNIFYLIASKIWQYKSVARLEKPVGGNVTWHFWLMLLEKVTDIFEIRGNTVASTFIEHGFIWQVHHEKHKTEREPQLIHNWMTALCIMAAETHIKAATTNVREIKSDLIMQFQTVDQDSFFFFLIWIRISRINKCLKKRNVPHE